MGFEGGAGGVDEECDEGAVGGGPAPGLRKLRNALAKPPPPPGFGGPVGGKGAGVRFLPASGNMYSTGFQGLDTIVGLGSPSSISSTSL